MLSLKNILIKRYDPTGLTLTWEFENTTELLSDYRIDIYRSQNPAPDIANYDVVATDVSATALLYKDVFTANKVNHNTVWYYRFRIHNISTLEQSYQPALPAYMNDEVPNFRWSKIVRHKTLGLERKVGRDVFLLKKRS